MMMGTIYLYLLRNCKLKFNCMKKILFVAACLTFGACGNNSTEPVKGYVDTVNCDSTVVDSVVTDTLIEDTVL